MAEESLKAQVTLTVDDSGAVQSVNNLAGAINTAGQASQSWAQQVGNLKKQLSSLDPSSKEWTELALQYRELGGSSKVVSESVEELKAKLNDLGGNVPTEPVKNFRQQIKELTNELQTTNLPKTSEEYQNLKRRLEQLKDAQKDFNEEIGANAGPAFESAGNNLRNLQSRLGSLDLDGAAQSINGLAANIKGLNFSGATEGSSAFGKSIVNLGKSLLANPIFLIGTVLALLITNFDKLANAIPGVGIAFEAIGAVIGAVKDAIFAFTDAIGLTAIAAGDAVDAAIGSLDENQKKLDNARRLAVANAQKTGEDVEAVNKEFRNKQVNENNNLINKVNALERKGVKLTKEQLDARKKAIDANTELAIQAAEKEAGAVQKTREDAAKEEEQRLEKEARAAEAARDKARQAADARKQKEKEVTDAIKEAQEQRFQATLSDEERELRQVELKYAQLLEKAGKNKDLINQIEEERFIQRQAIRDRYYAQEQASEDAAEAARLARERAAAAKANEQRIVTEDNYFKLSRDLENRQTAEREGERAAKKEREIENLVSEYDEKFALASGNADLEKQLVEQQKKDLARIDRQYKDEQKAADDKSNAERIEGFMKTSNMITQAATDGLSTLTSLNEAFSGKSEASQKKAFQRNKALQIAQAGVTTYQNAVAAASSQYVTGDPSSVVRAGLAAASAIAAGLANIAKIKATTFTSPAPSGGNNSTNSGGDLASTGVASSGVPEFNPLANLGLQNQPAQTIPAYVLAGDVANAMEAREKVTDLSRL
jgi:hypothetical protein